MPTPTKGKRLGGSASHQRLILANLATSLFEHRQITTTEAKARRLRPYAEHLITKARVDTLHNRRQVLKVIHDKSVVHELFTDIGPGFATRPGGYTRITKIGPRKGDNAPMAIIELVEAVDFGARAETTTVETPAATATETPAEAPVESSDAETAPTTDEDSTAAADETAPVEGEARDEEAEAAADAPAESTDDAESDKA